MRSNGAAQSRGKGRLKDTMMKPPFPPEQEQWHNHNRDIQYNINNSSINQQQDQLRSGPIMSSNPAGLFAPPSPSLSSAHVQQHSTPLNPAQMPAGLKKILHLYIHDYCLKQNFIKAANAMAADTGVRTDEGVPVGKDAPGGLLLQWFSQFWNTFSETNQRLMPSADEKRPSSSQQMQQQQKQPPYFLPSFMTSSNMKRIETEPTKGTSFNSHTRGDSTIGNTSTSSHTSTPMMTAQSWGFSGEVAGSGGNIQSPRHMQTPSMPLSQSAKNDTSMLIQKMGWGDQQYEDLNTDDKNQLIDVLKRSQMAQQQALERMAQTYPESVEPSANRGFNGTAFQQSTFNINLSPTKPDMQPMSSPQGSPTLGNALHYQQQPQQIGNGSKKASSVGSGRKKRRSSVNAQTVSQVSTAANHANATAASPGSVNARKGAANSTRLAPSPIIGTLAFQSEEQRLYETMSKQSPTKGRNGIMRRAQSTMTSPSSAYQAQNEASTQASFQINAQIAQLQNQLSRQDGLNGNSQLNANQISQLKVLQEKLNKNAKSAEVGQMHQQQQNTNLSSSVMARPTGMNIGEMGPPPSPGSQNSHFFMMQQQQPPLGIDTHVQGQMHSISAPGTPALTTSSTLSNTTPDWLDSSIRMMQESPVSTHLSPQSLAAFGASIDTSQNVNMTNPQPNFHQHHPQHSQNQQQIFQNSSSFHNQQGQKSPMMTFSTPTQDSEYVNFNYMGSMS